MLPKRSAVDSTIVSPSLSALPPAFGTEARFGSTLPHSDSACALESSRSSGTFEKFGSPLYAYRSLNASFLASTNRCQYFGLAGPSDTNVCPGAHFGTHTSRMLRISSVAHVCAGGGNV